MTDFLKTRRTKIIDGRNNKPVMLKGVNLGGWLMMEAYILHAPNFSEQKFKKAFAARLGVNALRNFERDYREHFITKKDIARIARLGMNCIRVPFNYRLIEHSPYRYDLAGVRFLDRVIRWAEEYRIWVILDLHAAPGAQNHDWHSDSMGKAELWTKPVYQKRTLALWEFLADRYKNEKWVAGYDILNEAVVDSPKKLNAFYKTLIRRIRSVDPNHVLFIEGNHWATDLECLDRFDDANYVLSPHSYEPVDFTFNFVSQLSYPMKSGRGGWTKTTLQKHLGRYKKISHDRGVPVLVGEFGVNARNGFFGEDLWLRDMLACCRRYDFHWTYWTYKAVKNGVLPDGLYSYVDNPPWVNRLGPVTGWDTYKEHWSQHRRAMIQSWDTDRFQPNAPILKEIRNAVK